MDDEEDYTTTDGEEDSSYRGCCCARGCGSCNLAFSQICFKGGPKRAEWDCGMCCALQCGICCTMCAGLLVAIVLLGLLSSTSLLLESHLDSSWGFLLDEGHAYTAPVWMGEFGNAVPGSYWMSLMQYLNKRDVDFAFWALNGKKYATGWIDTTNGKWVSYDVPRWENESYGVLEADYWTVRATWRLMDLQVLANSPAQWRPERPPCDREVFGTACGG